MRRHRVVLLVVSLTIVAVPLGVGQLLCSPALRTVGNPPADLPAESVLLRTTADLPVAGWFVRSKPGGGAVLLLHGVRSDRRQMIGRARFLSRAGYSVLLIDLPAHGESTAEHITYDANEAEGVKAALSFLSCELHGEKVGVIGVSLGAVTFGSDHQALRIHPHADWPVRRRVFASVDRFGPVPSESVAYLFAK
jgi:pimeloyl-ACP methyl ester carboxylesterase